MSSSATAAVAPYGVPLTVTDIDVPPTMAKRLLALGLRPGVQLTCVQRAAGGGRIVNLANSNIALGTEVLQGLRVNEAL